MFYSTWRVRSIGAGPAPVGAGPQYQEDGQLVCSPAHSSGQCTFSLGGGKEVGSEQNEVEGWFGLMKQVGTMAASAIKS